MSASSNMASDFIENTQGRGVLIPHWVALAPTLLETDT